MPKGNVRVEHLTALLRERGYKYKGQGDRSQMWRLPGTTNIVAVSRTEWTTEDRVRAVLRQLCLEGDEIETFIANYREGGVC